MNTTKRVLLRTSIVLAPFGPREPLAMPETDLLAADFVLSAKETVCVPSGEAP